MEKENTFRWRLNNTSIIFLLILSFKLITLDTYVNAQVDTTQLKLTVSQIESSEDHNEFWQDLYERDQTFRGVRTSKINDLENLVRAIYYLNRFGYPSDDIKAGRAMPLIWVHTSYPKVKQLAFPMILAGFHARQISEKTIRFYYIRNMHWRKFFNEENRTKDLDTIFAQLSLNVGKHVRVKDILRAYNESEAFLNQNFKIIGHWTDPKNDKSVKIMKSEDGAYYYHNLYADGSAYPEKIVQDNTYPNLYRNYFKPEFYFGVQPNGELSIKNTSGKRTLKPIKKIDRH